MYRIFLALRYLLSRPINLLGVAGVMVSVWALILVVSIFSGFLVEVRNHVKGATSHITVLRVPSSVSYAELAAIVNDDPGVAACAPRMVWYGLLQPLHPTHKVLPQVEAIRQPGAESPFVALIGIDPRAEMNVTGLARWLAAPKDPSHRVDDPSRPLAAIGGRDAILLSERRLAYSFAGKGGVVRITSGKVVAHAGGQQLDTLDAEFAIAGAFSTAHTAFDSSNCFIHIDALRRLLPGRVADPATEIVVRCHDVERAGEVAARLQRTINAALPPYQRGVLVLTWEQLNEQILSAVDHQRSLMKLVLFVIMVVAAFLMYATLSMMVTEKTRDIGILTAMGATRRGVVAVFLFCGLSIVTTGTVLGVIVGCLSARYLDPINQWMRATFGIDMFPTRIYNLSAVPYHLDPVWIAQVAMMSMTVGLIVSGLPAWRAARHDPVESLRYE